jgi:hypothetical protein
MNRPRTRLTINLQDPIELSTPKNIKLAVSEALEEERAIILQEPQNKKWSKVLEILHGEAKQRFFTRSLGFFTRLLGFFTRSLGLFTLSLTKLVEAGVCTDTITSSFRITQSEVTEEHR